MRRLLREIRWHFTLRCDYCNLRFRWKRDPRHTYGVNPTAELAFAAFTPNRSLTARRRRAGWTVRPATADERLT